MSSNQIGKPILKAIAETLKTFENCGRKILQALSSVAHQNSNNEKHS